MSRVVLLISRLISRSLRKELVTLHFSSVWTVELWIMKGCGLRIRWEGRLLLLWGSRFWLKAFIVETRRGLCLLRSGLSGSCCNGFRTRRAGIWTKPSKWTFHQIVTSRCTNWPRLRGNKLSRISRCCKVLRGWTRTCWVPWSWEDGKHRWPWSEPVGCLSAETQETWCCLSTNCAFLSGSHLQRTAKRRKSNS